MKKQTRRICAHTIKYFVSLLLIFLCISCDKEENNLTENSLTEESLYSVSKLSFDELQSDQKFISGIKSFHLDQIFENAKSSKDASGSTYIQQADFSLRIDGVKKLILENKISYTFLIEKDNNSIHFENLVIEVDNNGNTEGKIIKYHPTAYWNEGMDHPFEGTVQVSPTTINLNELLDIYTTSKNSVTQKSGDCNTVQYFTLFIEYACTGANHHGVDETEDCTCGVSYNCNRPESVAHTFTSYVPCNDFSAPVNTGGTGDNGGGGGGDVLGGDEPGSGTVVIGPDGINVPNRDFLTQGISSATYASTYADYFLKSYQLFNFMVETNFVQYDKPQHKPIYEELRKTAGVLYNKKFTYSIEDFEVLYGRQKFIIDVLDAVNFDFFALSPENRSTITETIMTMKMEMANREWNKNESGSFRNRSSLKYVATYVGQDFAPGEKMYLLESGATLFESTNRRIINPGDALTIGDTGNLNNHYYIHYPDPTSPRGGNENYINWYDVKLPPEDPRDDASLDFLVDAFWDGAVYVGRYAIPLEDVIIMIDGKDLDGVEANRYLAGGMFLVGLVPGGKLLKPAARLVRGVDNVWKVVVKVGDDVVELTAKVVNGVVDFGNRSKLAQVIATTAGEEAHHIIPWTRFKGNRVVQEAAFDGFHMNSKVNGRALQKYTSLTGEGLHGNHPQYDTYVQKLMDNFVEDNPAFSSEQARNFLERELIPELNTLIDQAKLSGLNLNEYFRLLNN